MANKIIVHGVGGCGINVTNESFSKVAMLGEGFCEVTQKYIDTSTANISKVKNTVEKDFWLITTKDKTKPTIKGSGGERRTHHLDISASVKDYITTNNWNGKKPSEFHFVTFSGSGGTGSVGGVILTQALISRDIPTVVFLIGDSSNGLNTKNTMDTIASLDRIARMSNKPLSVVYFNNHEIANNSSLGRAEKEVNTKIVNMASVLSLFLSGSIDDIDEQDMCGLIDQSHYRRISVEPGLYNIAVYTKDIVVPTGVTPTVNRTLTIDNVESDLNLNLLHNKKGYVVNSNARTIIKEDNFPVHLTSLANYFSIVQGELAKIEEQYNNIMAGIKNNSVMGTSDSDFDETTGLVL